MGERGICRERDTKGYTSVILGRFFFSCSVEHTSEQRKSVQLPPPTPPLFATRCFPPASVVNQQLSQACCAVLKWTCRKTYFPMLVEAMMVSSCFTYFLFVFCFYLFFTEYILVMSSCLCNSHFLSKR